MDKRQKRALNFAIGLAVGMAAMEFFFSDGFNILPPIVGGIIGGFAFYLFIRNRQE